MARLLLLLLLLAGCASFGTLVTDEQVDALQVGVTTEQEVRDLFGKPQGWATNSDGKTALVYSFGSATPFGAKGSSVRLVFGADGKLSEIARGEFGSD